MFLAYCKLRNHKRRYLRMLLALNSVASLTSCVPSPHVKHLRPEVVGSVTERGKPIPGVELFLGKFAGTNHPCTEVGSAVPVSTDGTFSWSSVRERKLMDSLINPVNLRGSLTVLCIRHPEKGVLIGALLMTKQDKPVSLRLVCEVSNPRNNDILGPNITATFIGQAHYCESSSLD